MLSSPLHTCVHCTSRITDPSDGQVVYIYVHYGVHGEMYIGIDSHLIDLSLCCIICSQIKKIRVLVVKPELLISCHPNELQSFVSPRGPLRQHPLAWESPKLVDYLAGRSIEHTVCATISAHEKLWVLCNIRAVWTVGVQFVFQILIT